MPVGTYKNRNCPQVQTFIKKINLPDEQNPVAYNCKAGIMKGVSDFQGIVVKIPVIPCGRLHNVKFTVKISWRIVQQLIKASVNSFGKNIIIGKPDRLRITFAKTD
jgi:hypothetical protein